jgi:hypothetical protein
MFALNELLNQNQTLTAFVLLVKLLKTLMVIKLALEVVMKVDYLAKLVEYQHLPLLDT